MRYLEVFRLSFPLSDLVLVPVHVHNLVAVPLYATALVTVRNPVPVPIPVPILCSSTGLHPRARSRSHYVPITVHAAVLAPNTVPVCVSAPNSDPAPDLVRIFPSLRSGYPLGTMRGYIPRFVWVSICVYVKLVAHNRAIQPCHPCHYIPLVFVLPRRGQLHLLRKYLITRDKENTLPMNLKSLLKP